MGRGHDTMSRHQGLLLYAEGFFWQCNGATLTPPEFLGHIFSISMEYCIVSKRCKGSGPWFKLIFFSASGSAGSQRFSPVISHGCYASDRLSRLNW